MGEQVSILGWGRSLGERNGNPLQDSGLENSVDRGAWRAIVHGVAKDTTERLSLSYYSCVCLSTHFIYPFVFQKTVDCMTTMSVPSTLVKCLYLFFDLPHVPEAVGGAQNELPLAERRGLLQKVFVQVWKVLWVCSCSPPYFRCNRYAP